MPYTIEKIQQPAGPGIKPVEQELIYVYSCLDAVQNELNVKYVFILGQTNFLGTIATTFGEFKTTPNNAGVGMMELSNLMSSYVGADNMSTGLSTWKNYGNGR